MKLRLAIVITATFFVVALASHSQLAPVHALPHAYSRFAEHGKLQEPLAMNGIKLSDSYGRVIQILGKPLKEKRTFNSEVEVTGTEWERRLEYDGAVLELASGKRSGPFDVVSIAISGGHWRLSHGLSLGMSEMEVVKALGPSEESSSSAGRESTKLWYVNPDGYGFTLFCFSHGHLKTIHCFIDLS